MRSFYQLSSLLTFVFVPDLLFVEHTKFLGYIKVCEECVCVLHVCLCVACVCYVYADVDAYACVCVCVLCVCVCALVLCAQKHVDIHFTLLLGYCCVGGRSLYIHPTGLRP